MRFFTLALIGWAVVGRQVNAAAQQPAAAPAPIVAYFDKDDLPLPSAKEACFRTETIVNDSTGEAVERRFSQESNRMRAVVRYDKVREKRRHGITEEYYDSGQLEVKIPYNRGKIEGEIVGYYPSGKLKRREQFRDYTSQGGEYFDEDGRPMAFVPYMVLPQYKGGMQGLATEIQQSTQYPPVCIRANE